MSLQTSTTRVESLKTLRASWMSVSLACALCGVSHIANAATYTGTGTVSLLSTHDTSIPGNDFFTLSGVTSLGTCGTYLNAVVFRLKDDARAQRHFSLVLAARSTGVVVSATVDDSTKDPWGYCYLSYIRW